MWSRIWDDSRVGASGIVRRQQWLNQFKEGDLSWLPTFDNPAYGFGLEIYQFMLEFPDGDPHVIHLCNILFSLGGNLNLIRDQWPRRSGYIWTGFLELLRIRKWKYAHYLISTSMIDITSCTPFNLLEFLIIMYPIPYTMSPLQIAALEYQKLVETTIDKICARLPLNKVVRDSINKLGDIQYVTWNVGGVSCSDYIHPSLFKNYLDFYNKCKRKYICGGYLDIIPRDIYNLILDFDQ